MYNNECINGNGIMRNQMTHYTVEYSWAYTTTFPNVTKLLQVQLQLWEPVSEPVSGKGMGKHGNG